MSRTLYIKPTLLALVPVAALMAGCANSRPPASTASATPSATPAQTPVQAPNVAAGKPGAPATTTVAAAAPAPAPVPAPAPQQESTRGAYGMPTGGFTTDLVTELRSAANDPTPSVASDQSQGGSGVPRGGFTTDLVSLINGKSASTTPESAPPPQGYVGTPGAGGKVAMTGNAPKFVGPNGKPQQIAAAAVPPGQQPAPQVQQPPAPPAQPSYSAAYGVSSNGQTGDLYHAIFGSKND